MKKEDFIENDYIGKFLLWSEEGNLGWFCISRIDDIKPNGEHRGEFIVRGPSVTWDLEEFRLDGNYKPFTSNITFFSYDDNTPTILISDKKVILGVVFATLRDQGATEDIINYYKTVFNK